MPSLKDLRNRIASVKATRKITKAMQMVAAAKLRRAQEAAIAARPYSDRMANVLGNLSSAMEGREDAPPLLSGTGKDAYLSDAESPAAAGTSTGTNSATGGKSGSISTRFVLVTPSARNLPALTYSIDAGVGTKMTSTCPLSISTRAGPPPR